ncbi:hypothetical protein B9Z55_010675 [Caenorhabditis nigoni]|uniref:C-type lectin domain-containing protein n=1 Tax=Caenorhabditis nigoni TaxID=1611254 RepID=A0A2G5UGU3_9PELO|nr:hypothetical protein B9Z55_010675 [Caenorhabditis nigoni]
MWKACFAFFIFLPVLTNAQCNPGSVYSNNRRFTLFPAQVDFKTAESICMVSNGHLASVHNTIDNNFLAQQAQKYVSGSSSIWLGAKSYSSDLNDSNSWNWTDGTQFNYQNYQSGQPESLETQACMQMSASNGKWRTSSCINYAPFICEYEIALPTTCTPPNYYSCPSGYYYYQRSKSCFKVICSQEKNN